VLYPLSYEGGWCVCAGEGLGISSTILRESVTDTMRLPTHLRNTPKWGSRYCSARLAPGGSRGGHTSAERGAGCRFGAGCLALAESW
jgi:hypothetical protein